MTNKKYLANVSQEEQESLSRIFAISDADFDPTKSRRFLYGVDGNSLPDYNLPIQKPINPFFLRHPSIIGQVNRFLLGSVGIISQDGFTEGYKTGNVAETIRAYESCAHNPGHVALLGALRDARTNSENPSIIERVLDNGNAVASSSWQGLTREYVHSLEDPQISNERFNITKETLERCFSFYKTLHRVSKQLVKKIVDDSHFNPSQIQEEMTSEELDRYSQILSKTERCNSQGPRIRVRRHGIAYLDTEREQLLDIKDVPKEMLIEEQRIIGEGLGQLESLLNRCGDLISAS